MIAKYRAFFTTFGFKNTIPNNVKKQYDKLIYRIKTKRETRRTGRSSTHGSGQTRRSSRAGPSPARPLPTLERGAAAQHALLPQAPQQLETGQRVRGRQRLPQLQQGAAHARAGVRHGCWAAESVRGAQGGALKSRCSGWGRRDLPRRDLREETRKSPDCGRAPGLGLEAWLAAAGSAGRDAEVPGLWADPGSGGVACRGGKLPPGCGDPVRREKGLHECAKARLRADSKAREKGGSATLASGSRWGGQWRASGTDQTPETGNTVVRSLG